MPSESPKPNDIRLLGELLSGMTVNLGIRYRLIFLKCFLLIKRFVFRVKMGFWELVIILPQSRSIPTISILESQQLYNLGNHHFESQRHFFSSSSFFAMIRGGHLDDIMLGSFQISQHCDKVKWIIPGKVIKVMGGAMDLLSTGPRMIVLIQHSALLKNGKKEIKLLSKCTFSFTGRGLVLMVITELAVLEQKWELSAY